MPSHMRITILYAIFGIVWILWSDTAVEAVFASNPDLLSSIQSVKGVLYVLVTSVLLFLLIYQENRSRQNREVDFRRLFMNNPQPMAVYNRKTLRFLEVNEVAVKVYGYKRNEFLAMTIKDIHPAEDVDRLLERLQRGHNSQVGSREWRHQLKSGEIIHVDVLAHEIKYQTQDAVIVTAFDVSERIQLNNERMKNQALHAALDKEIAARANRDRLASMVSHDLRTPLSTIMSSASMLELYDERYESVQRVRHYQKILRQAKELNEELEEILLWLRADSDTSTFQPVKTDIIEFVDTVVSEFSVPNNPQRVKLHAQDRHILAEIDPHLFIRVVSNLVSNACKYSAEETQVEVKLSKQQDVFELKVCDEGIGIPNGNIRHLFDAFYRADNVVNLQGTGLGLSIAKEIIELHHGTISVESTEGEGSTFTVIVPLSQVSA